jgi:hypothetical protein
VIVGLDAGDVVATVEGLVITLRRSKDDQEGEGAKIGLRYGSTPATCPVRAYLAWVALAGISGGPLFRPVDRHGRIGDDRLPDKAVAGIVKRRLEGGPTGPAG